MDQSESVVDIACQARPTPRTDGSRHLKLLVSARHDTMNPPPARTVEGSFVTMSARPIGRGER